MSTIISDNTIYRGGGGGSGSGGGGGGGGGGERKRNNNGDNKMKTRTHRKNVANNNVTTDSKKTRVRKCNTTKNIGEDNVMMRDNNDKNEKKRAPRSSNPFLSVSISVAAVAAVAVVAVAGAGPVSSASSTPTALPYSPTFNNSKKCKNTVSDSNSNGFGSSHDDKTTNINNNIFLAKSANNNGHGHGHGHGHFQENYDTPRYFNKNRANAPASVSDNGTNYFIHNSKIQHHRRQQAPGTGVNYDSSRAHNVTEKTKPKEPVIATINIQDTAHFPSLKSSVSISTSSVPVSTSAPSVWTKNKIKDIILSSSDGVITTTTAGDTASSGGSGGSASAIPEIKQACDLSSPPSSQAYDPPCKVKTTQPFLSRDNIFLAAFYSSSDDTTNTVDSVSESDSTTKTNDFSVPTSILVDTCDTRYDRLYDMVN